MPQRRRGQSLVELAMILPVLLLMFFGVMEFGWYLYNYVAVENAARRGSEQAAKEAPRAARVANATDGCVIEIRRQARLNLALIDIPDSDITVSYPVQQLGTDRELGTVIEVRITYQGQFLTPVMERWAPNGFTIDARSWRSILDTLVTQPLTKRCP